MTELWLIFVNIDLIAGCVCCFTPLAVLPLHSCCTPSSPTTKGAGVTLFCVCSAGPLLHLGDQLCGTAQLQSLPAVHCLHLPGLHTGHWIAGALLIELRLGETCPRAHVSQPSGMYFSRCSCSHRLASCILQSPLKSASESSLFHVLWQSRHWRRIQAARSLCIALCTLTLGTRRTRLPLHCISVRCRSP